MPGALEGDPQAEVQPVFAARLDRLRADAQNQYQSLRGEDQRRWQIDPAFTGDLLDPAGLHRPMFDREPLNRQYLDLTKDTDSAGTVADIIGIKQQIDYNAAEERAWRLRHASLVRCLVHSHGRRYGQGYGRPFQAVREMVTDIIAGGGRGS